MSDRLRELAERQAGVAEPLRRAARGDCLRGREHREPIRGRRSRCRLRPEHAAESGRSRGGLGHAACSSDGCAASGLSGECCCSPPRRDVSRPRRGGSDLFSIGGRNMALELYHHGSSACAAKVRFALGEKRLDWVGHYVDILNGEQFNPAFLALNPKAVVPVLVHDGIVIVESTVICEYVEETWSAHPIYPRSPLERARVRVWTKAVDEELHPSCSAITYAVSHRHTILRSGGGGSFDEFLARGVNEGSAARALKWQWIQQGLRSARCGRQDSTLRRVSPQDGERPRGRHLARRAAVLDGGYRNGAVRESARRARDARSVGAWPVAARRAMVRACMCAADVPCRVCPVVASRARGRDACEWGAILASGSDAARGLTARTRHYNPAMLESLRSNKNEVDP